MSLIVSAAAASLLSRVGSLACSNVLVLLILGQTLPLRIRHVAVVVIVTTTSDVKSRDLPINAIG